MSHPMKVLLVEDYPSDAMLIEMEVREELPEARFQVVETRPDFLAALESFQPDLILSDYSMPQFDGMTALRLARKTVPETPFIIVTGFINEETAVICMKEGAWDYVLKENLKRLKPAIQNALNRQRLIQERTAARAGLKMAHEKLLTILDGMDAAVYVADLNTREILFMNKTMMTSFGGDKTGQTCFKAFLGQSTPCDFCKNDQLLDERGQPVGVLIWEDPNKIKGKHYINRDRAIEWVDGRLVKLQVATDVTELKNMATQLLQAQKMESVGRLASGVAHDYNNMLTVIAGCAEMAISQIDPDSSVCADLTEILKAAHRSARITRQLLAFARQEAAAPVVLNLNEGVTDIVKLLRRLIGEDVELIWQPEAQLWPVLMDLTQLNQILINLAVNARDAIAGAGRLTIMTTNVTVDATSVDRYIADQAGEFVLLKVCDNGCGMDADIQARIFDPFFTTKEVGKGTGLGLSTVYGIVRQSKGWIRVDSQPETGTCFNIYLPRHSGDAETADDDVPALAPRGQGETVLLVEDELLVLKLTRKMLEDMGYTVLSAGTPAEALRLLKAHPHTIRLLMTDVIMPEMSGCELARRVAEQYPNINTLFMSAYTADVIAAQGGLEIAAMAAQGGLEKSSRYIQKPFSRMTLAQKVHQCLEGSNCGASGKSRIAKVDLRGVQAREPAIGD